jgi:hypothetical protein
MVGGDAFRNFQFMADEKFEKQKHVMAKPYS